MDNESDGDYESSITSESVDESLSSMSEVSDLSDVDVADVDGGQQSDSDPLYDGASISVFESYILCFQYAVRHSLTNVAFTELLQLISAHVPQSRVPTSVYRLKKFFLSILPQGRCKTHDYCADCHQLLLDDETTCDTDDCQNRSSSIKQFITIPLHAQLKRLMEGRRVYVAVFSYAYSYPL